MLTVTRSGEVRRIVRELSELPGSIAIEVCYRRLDVSAVSARYINRSQSFRADSVPEMLVVPDDAENLVIRVRGALPRYEDVERLPERVMAALKDMGIEEIWDVKACVALWQADQHRYELAVEARQESWRPKPCAA